MASSNPPPRVAMVAYTHYESDPRVRREAEALVRAGYAVDFLALRRPGQSPRETLGGVELFRLSQDRYRGASGLRYIAAYLAFAARAGWWLFRQTRRRAIRLIHVNTMPDFMVLCALWPRLVKRVPVILDIHDVMPEIFAGKFGVSLNHWKIRLLRRQEVWSTRLATAVLTVHEPLVDVLTGHGVKRSKVHVLINLPDTAVFGSPDEPAVPEEPGCFRMVYHGTLAHRLGLDIALHALAEARDRMDALGPWRLEVLGEGDQRDELLQLRDSLDLRDRVQFSDGFVPTADLPDLLRGAALGLVPLRAQADTVNMLPTKLLEYVHLGIPALARETVTIRHHFRDDQVRLIDSEETSAWADAILEMQADPLQRRRQAQAAREFAQTHRWETHQQVYVDLVGSLLGSGGASEPREGDTRR